VPLEPLLQAVVADVRALSAGRHPIALQVESDAGLRGAPAELDSAVRNLLTNAVRYTPDGGTITVTWRVVDGEGVLSVRDTGIGIAAEHLPRLTERFYRVDRARSRDSGGTGLGLAIVKRVLEEHGGDLILSDATLLSGARVTLQFPTQTKADAPASTIKSQKVTHGV
jgi:two-component system phosphate regulon sensor histidine kinase PhoR